MIPSADNDRIEIVSILNEEICSSNYNAYRCDGRVSSVEVEKKVEKSVPTHTFGKLKRWESKDKSRSIEEKTYKSILMKGLLSDRQREERGMFMPGEPHQSMDVARSIGLDDFVFAFFGIHDPYYASLKPQGKEPLIAPFGVFVKKEIENFRVCNVSRRDCASFKDENINLLTQFFIPSDARKLVVCDIHDYHNDDFWHYWGTDALWKNDYANDHWRNVFEFHYHKEVRVDKFEAILWPLERTSMSNGISYEDDEKEITDFKNTNMTCNVIKYRFESRFGFGSFVTASYRAIKHYQEHGSFPEIV